MLFSKQELADGCSPAAEEQFDARSPEMRVRGGASSAPSEEAVYYLLQWRSIHLTSADCETACPTTARHLRSLSIGSSTPIAKSSGTPDFPTSRSQSCSDAPGVQLDAFKRWLLSRKAAPVVCCRHAAAVAAIAAFARGHRYRREPHCAFAFIPMKAARAAGSAFDDNVVLSA